MDAEGMRKLKQTAEVAKTIATSFIWIAATVSSWVGLVKLINVLYN